MSFLSTTLSSAVGRDDTTITVAAITSFAAGMLAKIDGEIVKVVSVPSSASTPVPVIRGIQGAQLAHASGALVIVGATATATGTDWPEAAPAGFNPFAGPRIRTPASYSAAGAIALPPNGQTDVVAIINGTSALAMTLAVPTADLDGCILVVIGNGKAAHTLTVAGGMGAGGTGVDVGTFAAGAQQAVVLMACNAVWVPFPSFYGGSSLANVTITWA